MKVFRKDGTFITRAERQAIKEHKKDMLHASFAVIAMIVVIAIAYIYKIEIYL